MDSRFYRFYPERIIQNAEKIRKEFGMYFKDFVLAYSFKTNFYAPLLCIVKECGALAEVVSEEEYNLAVNAGFSEDRIIFNGVCKNKSLMIRCAKSFGIVNIDSEEELVWAEEYFAETGLPLSVGVRLNFDIGNCIKSRFGISYGSALYKRIVELDKKGTVKIKGLSCHFTNTRQCKFWARKADVLARAALDFSDIQYFDFGGSLAGSYEKTDTRKNPAGKKTDGEKIDFCSVAQSIFDTLLKYGFEKKKIIIESGTAVAGSAFDITAKVMHIKDEGFVILDISFTDMMIPALSDSAGFEIIHCGAIQKSLCNYTITGCTCLENDIIKKGFNGKLAAGDLIVFKNMGAYTLCFANNFIRPALPVLK